MDSSKPAASRHFAAPETRDGKVENFLRLPQVCARTGLARATVYKYILQQSFPAGVQLCPSRCVAWPESAIDKWITERIAASEVGKP